MGSAVVIQLAQQEQQSAEAAALEFESAAKRLGNGDGMPLDALQTIAQRAGKSIRELTKRTSYHESRNKQREKLKLADAARIERAELEREANAAREEFKLARNKFDQAGWKINARMEELQDMFRQADLARQMLIDKCDDPKIRGAITRTRTRLESITPRIREAAGLVKRLEELRRIGRETGPRLIQERSDSARAELSSLQAEESALVSEQARLIDSLVWA